MTDNPLNKKIESILGPLTFIKKDILYLKLNKNMNIEIEDGVNFRNMVLGLLDEQQFSIIVDTRGYVGDASMSPYEILFPGGANEHFNKIAGKDWLFKAISQWESHMWIYPVPKKYWDYTQTIKMVSDIFSGKMVPLTLSGLDKGMKQLMI